MSSRDTTLRCATKECNALAYCGEPFQDIEGQQYYYCINCLDRQAEREKERREFEYFHPSTG